MLEKAGLHDIRVEIPILDSLTIEANSAVKRLFPVSRRHGIMSNPLVKALDLALIAPTLAALPARDRIVLHLRFVEDLTQAEIAERVGVSQMHVSRLIRRALERLRTVAEHSG